MDPNSDPIPIIGPVRFGDTVVRVKRFSPAPGLPDEIEEWNGSTWVPTPRFDVGDVLGHEAYSLSPADLASRGIPPD